MLHTIIRPNTYQDSVSLMLLSNAVSASDRVNRVSVMMGTPANKEIFANTGFGTPELEAAKPGDMVIVIDSDDPGAADFVGEEVDRYLKDQAARTGNRTYTKVASLDRALSVLPDANLALISVPGEYAAAEAHRMLDKGLHVLLFSDNVTVEDEVALKTRGREQGLLVMGPDCGTAAIAGTPLAFGNVARRGGIGVVGASGTGTQEVMAQVDRLGGGISHAIGLGGRDLKEAVGGLTCLLAMDTLDADPSTEVVVLVSKPPAPSVRETVLQRAQKMTKPVVALMLGEKPDVAVEGNVTYAYTLEEAARLAVSTAPRAEARASTGDKVRGLFCGGTLASEAAMLLSDALQIPEDAEHAAGYMINYQGNQVIDLGDDAYTVGRPHPMIDPTLRNQMIAESFGDQDLGVLLLDVVLGYGSCDDPAGAVAGAVVRGREQSGRTDLPVVASICGTAGDPQGLADQERKLLEAGIVVLPNNASAVRYALALVAPRPESADQAPELAQPLARLLSDGPRVVNAGLEGFAEDLSATGAPVVQYAWAPLAGGDPTMVELLTLLS